MLHSPHTHLPAPSLDRDKRFASRTSHLTPGMEWIGGWAGLRICLDDMKIRKNSSFARNWWLISWTYSLLHCLLVKQAALKVWKIFTLIQNKHSARSSPSSTSHLMQDDNPFISNSRNYSLSLSFEKWSKYYILFHLVSKNYKLYSFLRQPLI